MKSAQLDVLHNTVEDLKNELAGFKKTMAGVCRKYDDNFRRNSSSFGPFFVKVRFVGITGIAKTHVNYIYKSCCSPSHTNAILAGDLSGTISQIGLFGFKI